MAVLHNTQPLRLPKKVPGGASKLTHTCAAPTAAWEAANGSIKQPMQRKVGAVLAHDRWYNGQKHTVGAGPYKGRVQFQYGQPPHRLCPLSVRPCLAHAPARSCSSRRPPGMHKQHEQIINKVPRPQESNVQPHMQAALWWTHTRAPFARSDASLHRCQPTHTPGIYQEKSQRCALQRQTSRMPWVWC